MAATAENLFTAYWAAPSCAARDAAVAAYADLDAADLDAAFTAAAKARAAAEQARTAARKTYGAGTPQARAAVAECKETQEREKVIHAAYNLRTVRAREQA